MDIKQLMQIDVDNLIQKQHDGLKEYVVNRMKEITELINLEMYDKVDSKLKNSPAGDSYGLDNNYINFNYDGIDRDISEVLSELENLKMKIK